MTYSIFFLLLLSRFSCGLWFLTFLYGVSIMLYMHLIYLQFVELLECIGFYFTIRWGRFSAIISLNFLLLFFLTLLLVHICWCYGSVPHFSAASSIFPHSFYLCYLDHIMSIDIFSNLLVFLSTSSKLLLNKHFYFWYCALSDNNAKTSNFL